MADLMAPASDLVGGSGSFLHRLDKWVLRPVPMRLAQSVVELANKLLSTDRFVRGYESFRRIKHDEILPDA